MKLQNCVLGLTATLSLLFMTTTPADAGEVVFPKQPRWTMSQYLSFFYRSVPLDQLIVSSTGDAVELVGPLTLELGRVPDTQRPLLKKQLDQVFRGELQIAGARVGVKAAQIEYQMNPEKSEIDEPRADEVRPQPLATDVTAARLSEAEVRELPAMNFDPPSWVSSRMFCGQLLQGHVER